MTDSPLAPYCDRCGRKARRVGRRSVACRCGRWFLLCPDCLRPGPDHHWSGGCPDLDPDDD